MSHTLPSWELTSPTYIWKMKVIFPATFESKWDMLVPGAVPLWCFWNSRMATSIFSLFVGSNTSHVAFLLPSSNTFSARIHSFSLYLDSTRMSKHKSFSSVGTSQKPHDSKNVRTTNRFPFFSKDIWSQHVSQTCTCRNQCIWEKSGDTTAFSHAVPAMHGCWGMKN